ncbi:MAG: hypothetical protein EZS28_035877 [Streblomastix strix]|uniref:Uncharacterized protein n=1 Tax=Streblomastix strix TaxID=222440 RepID=A0A5J4UGD4_9EUKA|nr:MAG: hypothetical protein EZS28_035877 [Streblomastix strix]
MCEQIQQSQSSIFQAPTIPQRLGYVSRTKPRVHEIDYYGNKGMVLPYERYEKTLGPKYILDLVKKDNQEYLKV